MKLVPLGEVCVLVNGGTPDTKIHEYWGGPHAWITPAEMGNLVSPFLGTSRRTLTNEGLRNASAQLLPKHSVIMSSRAPIGHLVINEVPMATNQGCKGLIPNSELNYKYLYYFLYANKEYLNSLGSGTTFAEISGTKLKTVEIPLPPLEKQREIVEKLDSTFVEIGKSNENGVSVQNFVNSLLSRLIDAWINSHVNSKKANLEELAVLKGRIGWRGLSAKEYTKEGPLFLSVHSLNHGHFVDFSRAFHISQERYDESPEIQLSEGYILIAKDGYVGKVGMVGKLIGPTTVNSSLLVVKPSAQVLTKYLYCYFLSSDFKKLVQDRLAGSTIPHLYQRDIAKIPVTLLNIEQQFEFITKFDIASKLIEDLLSNLEIRRQLILELEKALLASELTVA
jgi:type I restriction enzyme S subunit